MSTRSLIEINHDYLMQLLSSGELVAYVRSLANCRGPETPIGVTYHGERHHSDPPFMSYQEQRDTERHLERLREGKRVVTKKKTEPLK